MKLSLPSELLGKLAGSQLFRLVKFSFPVTRLMSYYAETDRSHPPNRRTLLQISLMPLGPMSISENASFLQVELLGTQLLTICLKPIKTS
jgi:hypothetical protein